MPDDHGLDAAGLRQARDAAVSWAQDAGRLISSRFRTPLTGQRKADRSLVTEVDLAASAALRTAIHARYPDHAVLSEEDPEHAAPAAGTPLWVVDPIDGTRNYAHGFPGFCTAVALLLDGVPVLGVVHEPLSGMTLEAIRDQGGRWNGVPFSTAPAPSARDRLVAVPLGSHLRLPSALVDRLADRAVLRNVGSTCLHLAWVAGGALDGAVACHAKLWDVAAGACLLQEAGAGLVDGAGRPVVPFGADAYRGVDLAVAAWAADASDLRPLLLSALK